MLQKYFQALHDAVAYYKEIFRTKSEANKQRLLDFYFQKPSPSAAEQQSALM
jgi:hypothetical protein